MLNLLTTPMLQRTIISTRLRFSGKICTILSLIVGVGVFLSLIPVSQLVVQGPAIAMSAYMPTKSMALRFMQPTEVMQFLRPVTPWQSMQPAKPWLSVHQGKPLLGMATGQSMQEEDPWRKQAESMDEWRNYEDVDEFVEDLDGNDDGESDDENVGLPWVVLKYGGTSVATPERWGVIITELKRVRAGGERPFLVVSALSQVTNRLGKALEEAINDVAPASPNSSYSWIKSRHMELAEGLGVQNDKEGMEPLLKLLDALERLLEGVRMVAPPQPSPRLVARVTAYGELMSSQLGVLAINKAGIPCVRLDSRKLLKSTETLQQQEQDRFLNANVEPSFDSDLVASQLSSLGGVSSDDPQKSSAVIAQGFIASKPSGETCLLGRGGSDTSGALFAALVGAAKYEIWTDVHGLFTSDPRVVDNTRLIKQTSYRMAQELASTGAKVLHERCLGPASWGGIPVEVHNTQDPQGPITRIAVEKTDTSDSHGKPRVMGVTSRTGQVLLSVKKRKTEGEAGFLTKVFGPFSELDVSADLVAVSPYVITVTLDYIPGGVHGEVFSRLVAQLSQMGVVNVQESVAVISIIGEHLREAMPELGQALQELKKRSVYLMSQSSEDLNLSFVVDESQVTYLVQGLHNRLFPSTATGGSGSNLFHVDEDKAFGETWEELKAGKNLQPR